MMEDSKGYGKDKETLTETSFKLLALGDTVSGNGKCSNLAPGFACTAALQTDHNANCRKDSGLEVEVGSYIYVHLPSDRQNPGDDNAEL